MLKILKIGLIFCLLSQGSLAQTKQVPFGPANHDTSLPVEIVSDSFNVNQSDGTAEFSGNVVVGQGDMRLSAGKIAVEYANIGDGEQRKIGRLIASGGITLVNGDQAAEAQTADYSIDTGNIVLKGNVLMTQGENALAGQQITIDLNTGSAQVEGRVKTIFQTGEGE